MTRRASERSYAPLTGDHLARLRVIAADDRERFHRNRPEYRNRHLCTVLAQGGALHFLNGTNGVKDLDVWSFYSLIPGSKWPADRRNTHTDFGESSLGRQTYDAAQAPDERTRRAYETWSGYTGRRVDLLMRALPVGLDADPAAAVRAWLRAGRRKGGSAWYLAQKAVVLIDPPTRCGEVIWPT
jgi:hypothetical protein